MHVGLKMENKWFFNRLSDVNLDEICRLCLSNKGIMSSIFGSKRGSHLLRKLPSRITEMTSIKIEEEDGLPSQICHSCLYNLERLSEFKQNCIESDTLLREYLRSRKIKGEFKSAVQDMKPQFKFVTTEHIEESDEHSYNEEEDVLQESGKEVNSFDDPSELVENSLEPFENGIQHDDEIGEEEEESITQQPFSIDLWGFQRQEQEDNDVESMVMVVDPSSQPMDDRCSDSEPESESFREKNMLESNWEVQKNHQDYNFNCTTCNKGFVNEEQLGRHYLIHTQEAPFPCDFCEKEFEERNLLKRHWRSHAGNKPYICFTCGDAFLERPQLAQHQVVHDCIKPFHCANCGKAFAYKSDLRKHAVIHSGIRPYVCKICSKSFTRSTNLNKHARVHSGRRPFACEHCKKMFASRGDLTRHTVIHTGEKPYACTICDLAFNRKDKLSRHEKLHAGERAFACPECPTSYHRKEELTKHMQFHHFKPDPDYKCKIKRSNLSPTSKITRASDYNQKAID